MRGLFITGTDTGVGKTYVACSILRELRQAGVRAGAYKPACSGAEVLPDGRRAWADVDALAAACDEQFPRERICPQCLTAPLAPPAAAALEGRRVDEPLLAEGRDWWIGQVDFLLVEGAGGLLSPLGDDVLNADLAASLGYPVLVVAADRLGTINHTLLTVEAALARKLQVAGIVLNRLTADPDLSAESNYGQLQQHCPVPVLGVWPFRGNQLLRPGATGTRIDWRALANA